MAAVVQSFTSADGGASAVGSLVIAGTATTNLMVVMVGYRGAAGSVTGISWNTSQSFTRLGTAVMADTQEAGGEIWYLKLPAAGAFNAVATLSTNLYVAGVLENISGADIGGSTFGPQASYSSASSSAGTVTITSVADDLCIDILAKKNSTETQTVNAGQTLIATDNSTNATGANNIVVGASYKPAVGASTGMGWASSSARAMVEIGFAVKAAQPASTQCIIV